MTVEARYALLVGSKLVDEDRLAPPLPDGMGGQGFIDGAIVLRTGETTLLDERFWDRLDESLCLLLKGFENCINGETVEIELPDTRLLIELEQKSPNEANCTIEYRETVIPLRETHEALSECAKRFLAAVVELPQKTPHILELEKLIGGA